MSKLNSVFHGIGDVMQGISCAFTGTWVGYFLGLDTPPLKKERQFSFPLSDLEAFKRDREALASDWLKIGNDMRKAMDEYVKTH